LGLGDITSDNIFTPQDRARAVIVAKEDLVLCGMDIAQQTFWYVDETVTFTPLKKDGDFVKKGDVIATIYSDNENSLSVAGNKLLSAIKLSEEKTDSQKLIYKII
jgi:nicotinate-nucleotide pyrophosphorylase (carboxylating)